MNIFLMLSVAVLFLGCASNPNKAEKIETEIKSREDIGGGVVAGLNDKGEMVASKKVKLGTYLRDLQKDVYSLETEIYGDTNNRGLYGSLRDCRDKSRSKEYGGDGKVTPPPQKNILTKSEDMTLTPVLEKLKAGKIGEDESKQLVAVSEDYLLDRIKRFEKYKDDYEERKTQFDEEIRKCQAEIKERQNAKKGNE